MCGIVGYIGNSQCFPILIKGLHRLEYRGYDSAGVAIIDAENQLKLCKSRGKVAELESFCQSKDVSGTIGIAHTRWATHGEPNDTNAHPHVSADGNIAIVHNGTIENYNVLKRALMKHGCEFKSETDTEVLVQLIQYIKQNNSCTLVGNRIPGTSGRCLRHCRGRPQHPGHNHCSSQKLAPGDWNRR